MLDIIQGRLTDYIMIERNTLNVEEQKRLIRWFWENRASWVREIVCEECLEHMG